MKVTMSIILFSNYLMIKYIFKEKRQVSDYHSVVYLVSVGHYYGCIKFYFNNILLYTKSDSP